MTYATLRQQLTTAALRNPSAYRQMTQSLHPVDQRILAQLRSGVRYRTILRETMDWLCPRRGPRPDHQSLLMQAREEMRTFRRLVRRRLRDFRLIEDDLD